MHLTPLSDYIRRMPLWRLALKISNGLMWTVCVFLGGYLTGQPIGEVIFLTLGIAYITGTLELAATLIVRALAKYPPTLD